MIETALLEAAIQYSGNVIIIGSSLRNDRGQVDGFRIRWASANISELTSRPLTESIGLTLNELFAGGLPSSLFSQLIDVVETGNSREVESQLRLTSGETHWFLVRLNRYEEGICLSMHTITARKQAEQNLLKTIEDLKRSNQNLEQFAYVASHDLQEPLRKLIGFGDILQNQYGAGLGEQGAKLVQRMQVATQRMHTLIKDILSFSRLSATQEPFKRVDLQAVVNNVISDLEPVIREKKAVLDVTSLPYLEGNAGQLSHLFQNLLSNALKFTRPGDIPLIRIDCEVILGSAIEPMPGTTVLTTDLNRSFFAIIVSDNGIGFDEKHRERIFSIFQRLHGRSEYPGTGIGLAVVQKVVENHRGYLNAHSQPGKGAEFTVYLPDEPALPEAISRLSVPA